MLEAFIKDPVIWIALLLAVLFLAALYSSRKRTQFVQEFAASRGFEFEKTVQPALLGLPETSFFRKHDKATNVMRGVMSGCRFTYFEHFGTRGKYRHVNNSMMVFESSHYWPAPSDSFSLKMEQVNGRIFLWRESGLAPLLEMDTFLQLTLMAYQSAAR